MPIICTSKTAIISPDLIYRYELTREWLPNFPTLNWIMLNPSTATADVDDPTIRRVMTFSNLWGYGGMRVYNLFALRATDPGELKGWSDPVGPENDSYLNKIPREELIVAAWGGHASDFPDRVDQVRQILNGRLCRVLGWTSKKQPKHPLYLASLTQLKGWESATE